MMRRMTTPLLTSPIDSDTWRAGPPMAAGQPLPMRAGDLPALGWDACDIILVTGDAYVDHPSFGAALIGRLLASRGYRVGIIAQPVVDRRSDFSCLGIPRLFWGVTAGNLDSQLSRLTVMRKRRRDDPYAPDGVPDRRPPNASIAYTARIRELGGGVPVVLGGLEASLRRFAFYDYWTSRIRRSILFDAKADLLVYGMAERAILEVARRCRDGESLSGIAGTAEITSANPHLNPGSIRLPAFEDLNGPDGGETYRDMSRQLFNRGGDHPATTIVQPHGARFLVAHPSAKPLTTPEMDFLYGLPFTRRPHPAYGKARIPAFEMIRHSVTTHRGCYGGCAFCAIGVHQGSTICSRSPESIIRELKTLAMTPGFRGTISDLGGPTANMYATGCRLQNGSCPSRHCLFPEPCPNLNTDQGPLTSLLKRVRTVAGIRHVYCASGIRPDLTQGPGGDSYIRELAAHHVGGRLKLAPEHVSQRVLERMRKPSRQCYDAFLERFHRAADTAGKRYPVVEYYISGHPGCTLDDMLELALFLRRHGIAPEQVQDFYPAPMTIAAAMHVTGHDPLTDQPTTTVRTDRQKSDQRALLLCHRPEFQARARTVLKAMGRQDLIGHGRAALVPPATHPRKSAGIK